MSRSTSVAVVAEIALVRQGLGLQLRLAGVEVAHESPSVAELLAHLDPGGVQVDTAVVLGSAGCETEHVAPLDGVRLLLARGTNVVLVVGGDRPAAIRMPGLLTTPSGDPGVARGAARLVTVRLADVQDIQHLMRVVRTVARPVRPVTGTRDFTRAEFVVHSLVAHGYSNAGIATLLGVSRKTVECHVSNVFAKLDLAREDGTYNRRVSAALRWSSADGPVIDAPTNGRLEAAVRR